MGPTRIALITDSTWSLPVELARDLGIEVVPMHLDAGRTSLLDRPEDLDAIMSLLGNTPATTSQPTPGEVREVLERCVARGARTILCIHLSGQLSGTTDSVRAVAATVATDHGVAVEVVDSRTVGGALGYAVALAGAALVDGAPAATAVARARECAATSRVYLTVADLRHLQRGGRLRAPQAAIGAALGIKPLLHIQDGEIRLLESVRGAARAQDQLVRRALLAAGAPTGGPREPREPVSFAVHHADAGDAAGALAGRLAADSLEAGIRIDRLDVTPMSGVLAAHAGPGALAVAVARTRGLLHS